MSEEELAVSDNSQEPQSDNQEQETLLNPTIETQEAEAAEPDAMPHLEGEEQPQEEEAIDWGDRPEWIPQQFWSDDDGPDVEGVFKSYNELRSKMSAGLHKAPKDGKYDVAVMSDVGVADDDPMLEQFIETAKESGLSQDGFNQLASLYLDAVGAAEEAAQTSMAEERAKLGRNADKVIDETNKWLTKLGTSGVLNGDEMEAIANASNNAFFITGLNKIRQSYNEAPIPTIDIQEGNTMTRSDLDSMVADPRYGVDMNYTNQVEREFMKAFGEA